MKVRVKQSIKVTGAAIIADATNKSGNFSFSLLFFSVALSFILIDDCLKV